MDLHNAVNLNMFNAMLSTESLLFRHFSLLTMRPKKSQWPHPHENANNFNLESPGRFLFKLQRTRMINYANSINRLNIMTSNIQIAIAPTHSDLKKTQRWAISGVAICSSLIILIWNK